MDRWFEFCLGHYVLQEDALSQLRLSSVQGLTGYTREVFCHLFFVAAGLRTLSYYYLLSFNILSMQIF